MNRSLLMIVTLVVALGAVGAIWFVKLAPEPGPGIAAANAQNADIDTSGVLEMSIGNPDAKVTVIEYASFTCPHCKNFHSSVLKDLTRDYIDTGKINFIYREVYFDRFGLWAGIIARCGGPDRYFGIADLIYEQQSEWTASSDPAVIAGNLRQIGKSAGLTDTELDVCLSDNDKAQAMVALYQKNAQADDINSTPSFIINGESFGNMNYADFAAALDVKLAE